MEPIDFAGASYQYVYGSDVPNEGMYIELIDASTGSPETVLFAFRSDATGEITLDAYRENIPLALVELFIARARRAPAVEGAIRSSAC